VPPMPWIATDPPERPVLGVSGKSPTRLDWEPGSERGVGKWVIGIRASEGREWTFTIAPASERSASVDGGVDGVAICGVDRAGNLGIPAFWIRGGE
jgi:hypothetical protein